MVTSLSDVVNEERGKEESAPKVQVYKRILKIVR